MIRDEKTGKFVAAESEQEKLEKQIAELQARLVEARKAEEEKVLAEKKKAEEEKSLARKADVIILQDAASNYLKLVKENNDRRAAMHTEEQKLYDAYQAKLREFANKHQGYHLTYTVNGDNVEFKVEEARANVFDQIRKEQNDFIKKFWNNMFNF